jgi:hypothetical protein
VSSNVQACASRDTFAKEIVDPASSRVFARSSFANGHERDAPDVEAAAFAVTVFQSELADASPLAPQAATSNPAATASTRPSVMRPRVIAW